MVKECRTVWGLKKAVDDQHINVQPLYVYVLITKYLFI